VDMIRKRKLQLFTQICGMPDCRLLKTLMFGMVEIERRRRRPASWSSYSKDATVSAMLTEDVSGNASRLTSDHVQSFIQTSRGVEPLSVFRRHPFV